MLQAFREHKRWLMVIAMVFIIPSFVVTGIYSYNRMTQSDNSIVKVGEVSITPENFDLAKRQQLERLRQQMGESFHASLLDTPQAREDLLRMLMDKHRLWRSLRTLTRLRLTESSLPSVMNSSCVLRARATSSS